MKLFEIILVLSLFAAVIGFTGLFIFDRSARKKLVSAINVVLGPAGKHANGNITMKAAAAITESHLLVVAGTGSNNGIATQSAAITDVTIGVATDQAKAANDPINVALHGGAGETRLVRVNAAINPGELLVPDTNGRAKKFPATSGTWYVFGVAVTEGAQGDLVEYFPAFQKIIV